MKTRTILFSLLVLTAVLLSACAPGVAAGGVQPAARSITVSGAGQVTLTPDIAYIYIGVRTEKNTAADAVSENNAQTTRLVEALKKAGVAAEDIRTSNFSIWSNQQYGPDGLPTGETIYAVDNTVYVTVRDLATLGDLLDKAVQAGANSINSISFDVADKSAALSEARKSAVEAARQQAEELAAAAGVGLGEVQTITYFDATPYPAFDGKGMGGGGAAEMAVPINPGTMQLTVTVTIAYEIK